MSAEHDLLRARLGRVGAWTFAFDSQPAEAVADAAREIESMGYPALWVPEGGGSRDIIGHLSWLLANTSRITIASGIANITAREPEVLQAGATLLADAYGGRAVLGVGVGHPYSTEARGYGWAKPLERMRTYLDAMDEAADRWPAPAVPPQRMLAALGDGMLGMAGSRALGAHTYFVPVVHTVRARELLGRGPVLAVEQTVVLERDPEAARGIARAWTRHYLESPNYANNWLRSGFGPDDVAEGGSDRLIDAAIAWGDAAAVAARVKAHLEAGADHGCVQVISGRDADACVPQLSELAPLVLGL